MRALPTLALVLLLAPAFGQFQVVHDVPITTSAPNQKPVILSDDNVLTCTQGSEQHILRKYDTQGTLLWSKGFDGPFPNVIADASGGFIMSRFIDQTLTYVPIGDFEKEIHTEVTFEICRVNGNGEVIDARILTESEVWDSNDWNLYNASFFTAARAPDGSLILVISYTSSDHGVNIFAKLGPDGSLAWVRTVGQDHTQYNDGISSTYVNSEYYAPIIKVSSSGHIVFSGSPYPDWPYSFEMMSLSPDGEVLWKNSYSYGNTSFYARYPGIDIDAEDRIQVGGGLGNSVGNFYYFMRTTEDGVLDRVDLYRAPLLPDGGTFAVDDLGRRILYNTGNPPYWPEALLVADTLGNPANLQNEYGVVVLPHNVMNRQSGTAHARDRIAIAGSLRHEHVDLGFTTYYASLSSAAIDELERCSTTDSLLAHIPVPLEIMTTTPVDDIVSIDIMDHYSTEPTTVTLTDLDAEQTEALCGFVSQIVGIGIGIEETEMALSPLLTNTLVAQGAPLYLNTDVTTTIEVYTVNGQLVHRERANGSSSIHTVGWTPGIYMIRADDGRSARVVVE